MAEPISDPDISDSPTDEDDDEDEDEEGEGEAEAALEDADEEEEEEDEEGSIAGRRFHQRQHPYPRYHLHPQQHHLMQFQPQQQQQQQQQHHHHHHHHHHHQQQQQHHQQQLGEKNSVQQAKLGRTPGRDYTRVDVDEDDDEEEDDGVDVNDDDDDDVDEEDGVGEEDDDDADIDIDDREEREEGRAEEEDDEDFESPEKPQHMKDYDPAEPLALEDLMMEKEELAASHDGDEEGNDDNASLSPSGAGACPEAGVAATGEEEHAPPTTFSEPEREPESEHGILDFMKRPPEMDEGTLEEQANFVKELERFFIDRKMEYRPPKFYRENLNCLKLWRTVIRLGGYDTVTSRKLWRQVGDTFKPPKSCTTVSWSFRGFYEKALLDYERFKLHGICPNAGQGDGQYEEGAPSNPNTAQPGYMPNLGRARRDAASRAMQGWHSQRYFGSEVADPVIKERSSNSASKRAKQLKMGLLKRKKATSLERDVQAARMKGTTRVPFLTNNKIKDDSWEEVGNQSFFNMPRKKGKQGHAKQEWGSNLSSDVWVTDEGPQADWVKINVHKTHDCFEVYALVPGLVREEVRVQCEPGGQLMIVGDPEQPDNPWGVTSFKKVINLASPIDASQTSAVFTLHGQLFIRVPFSQGHA